MIHRQRSLGLIALLTCSFFSFFFFFLRICSVIGSMEQPLSGLSLEGSIRADGESVKRLSRDENGSILAPGGGSGGTVLLFLRYLVLGESSLLSSAGGSGSPAGGGGGGGGRIHFHWSNIPTGDIYQPIASVKGIIHARLSSI